MKLGLNRFLALLLALSLVFGETANAMVLIQANQPRLSFTEKKRPYEDQAFASRALLALHLVFGSDRSHVKKDAGDFYNPEREILKRPFQEFLLLPGLYYFLHFFTPGPLATFLSSMGTVLYHQRGERQTADQILIRFLGSFLIHASLSTISSFSVGFVTAIVLHMAWNALMCVMNYPEWCLSTGANPPAPAWLKQRLYDLQETAKENGILPIYLLTEANDLDKKGQLPVELPNQYIKGRLPITGHVVSRFEGALRNLGIELPPVRITSEPEKPVEQPNPPEITPASESMGDSGSKAEKDSRLPVAESELRATEELRALCMTANQFLQDWPMRPSDAFGQKAEDLKSRLGALNKAFSAFLTAYPGYAKRKGLASVSQKIETSIAGAQPGLHISIEDFNTLSVTLYRLLSVLSKKAAMPEPMKPAPIAPPPPPSPLDRLRTPDGALQLSNLEDLGLALRAELLSEVPWDSLSVTIQRSLVQELSRLTRTPIYNLTEHHYRSIEIPILRTGSRQRTLGPLYDLYAKETNPSSNLVKTVSELIYLSLWPDEAQSVLEGRRAEEARLADLRRLESEQTLQETHRISFLEGVGIERRTAVKLFAKWPNPDEEFARRSELFVALTTVDHLSNELAGRVAFIQDNPDRFRVRLKIVAWRLDGIFRTGENSIELLVEEKTVRRRLQKAGFIPSDIDRWLSPLTASDTEVISPSPPEKPLDPLEHHMWHRAIRSLSQLKTCVQLGILTELPPDLDGTFVKTLILRHLALLQHQGKAMIWLTDEELLHTPLNPVLNVHQPTLTLDVALREWIREPSDQEDERPIAVRLAEKLDVLPREPRITTPWQTIQTQFDLEEAVRKGWVRTPALETMSPSKAASFIQRVDREEKKEAPSRQELRQHFASILSNLRTAIRDSDLGALFGAHFGDLETPPAERIKSEGQSSSRQTEFDAARVARQEEQIDSKEAPSKRSLAKHLGRIVKKLKSNLRALKFVSLEALLTPNEPDSRSDSLRTQELAKITQMSGQGVSNTNAPLSPQIPARTSPQSPIQNTTTSDRLVHLPFEPAQAARIANREEIRTRQALANIIRLAFALDPHDPDLGLLNELESAILAFNAQSVQMPGNGFGLRPFADSTPILFRTSDIEGPILLSIDWNTGYGLWFTLTTPNQSIILDWGNWPSELATGRTDGVYARKLGFGRTYAKAREHTLSLLWGRTMSAATQARITSQLMSLVALSTTMNPRSINATNAQAIERRNAEFNAGSNIFQFFLYDSPKLHQIGDIVFWTGHPLLRHTLYFRDIQYGEWYRPRVEWIPYFGEVLFLEHLDKQHHVIEVNIYHTDNYRTDEARFSNELTALRTEGQRQNSNAASKFPTTAILLGHAESLEAARLVARDELHKLEAGTILTDALAISPHQSLLTYSPEHRAMLKLKQRLESFRALNPIVRTTKNDSIILSLDQGRSCLLENVTIPKSSLAKIGLTIRRYRFDFRWYDGYGPVVFLHSLEDSDPQKTKVVSACLPKRRSADPLLYSRTPLGRYSSIEEAEQAVRSYIANEETLENTRRASDALQEWVQRDSRPGSPENDIPLFRDGISEFNKEHHFALWNQNVLSLNISKGISMSLSELPKSSSQLTIEWVPHYGAILYMKCNHQMVVYDLQSFKDLVASGKTGRIPARQLVNLASESLSAEDLFNEARARAHLSIRIRQICLSEVSPTIVTQSIADFNSQRFQLRDVEQNGIQITPSPNHFVSFIALEGGHVAIEQPDSKNEVIAWDRPSGRQIYSLEDYRSHLHQAKTIVNLNSLAPAAMVPALADPLRRWVHSWHWSDQSKARGIPDRLTVILATSAEVLFSALVGVALPSILSERALSHLGYPLQSIFDRTMLWGGWSAISWILSSNWHRAGQSLFYWNADQTELQHNTHPPETDFQIISEFLFWFRSIYLVTAMSTLYSGASVWTSSIIALIVELAIHLPRNLFIRKGPLAIPGGPSSHEESARLYLQNMMTAAKAAGIPANVLTAQANGITKGAPLVRLPATYLKPGQIATSVYPLFELALKTLNVPLPEKPKPLLSPRPITIQIPEAVVQKEPRKKRERIPKKAPITLPPPALPDRFSNSPDRSIERPTEDQDGNALVVIQGFARHLLSLGTGWPTQSTHPWKHHAKTIHSHLEDVLTEFDSFLHNYPVFSDVHYLVQASQYLETAVELSHIGMAISFGQFKELIAAMNSAIRLFAKAAQMAEPTPIPTFSRWKTNEERRLKRDA